MQKHTKNMHKYAKTITKCVINIKRKAKNMQKYAIYRRRK